MQESQIIGQQWAGPLPPPAILEQFDGIVENGAERIFQAWEGETAHRHKMENRNQRAAIFEAVFGKVLAFLFILLALGLAAYAASIGATWLSALFGGGILVSVVWAFVKTNRNNSR